MVLLVHLEREPYLASKYYDDRICHSELTELIRGMNNAEVQDRVAIERIDHGRGAIVCLDARAPVCRHVFMDCTWLIRPVPPSARFHPEENDVADRRNSSATARLPSLSAQEARVLVLRAQGFGASHLREPIHVRDHLGYIQVNSVNVVTLQGRKLGGHSRRARRGRRRRRSRRRRLAGAWSGHPGRVDWFARGADPPSHVPCAVR